MVEGPPSRTATWPPPGWYPDPVAPSRFRQWTGEAWTSQVFDGELGRDTAIVENLPRPATYPAPEIPPPPPRDPFRRIAVITGLIVAVLLAIVVFFAVVRLGSGPPDGLSIDGPAAAVSEEAETTTTVRSVESVCIENVMAAEDPQTRSAIEQSSELGLIEVDHAWSDLAERLDVISLSGCPSEFTALFSTYIGEIDALGSYLDDRTGSAIVDDYFNGDDVGAHKTEMLAGIATTYEQLRAQAAAHDVDTAGRPFWE